MGTLMGKRMLCDSSGCSVTKIGVCIDVREPVFVPEYCDANHSAYTDGTAAGCTPCGVDYQCDVPNLKLAMNVGIRNSTIPSLNITNLKLDAKSMRVRFATLATAILQRLNGNIEGSPHQCHVGVVEKADNFLKLS